MADEFPGQIPTPLKIAGNRAAGWAMAMQDADWQRKIMRWSGIDEEVRFTPLPAEAALINLGTAFQGLRGGRFILGGRGNAYSPVNVIECDPDTGQKLDGFQFGDARTNQCYAVPLSNGGLAGVAFQEVDSYRSVSCYAFYRKPTMPPAPPTAGYNPWWVQRFDFGLPREGTGDSTLPGLNAAVAQGPDGRLYAFMVRDGLGEIWALAFDVLPDRLEPAAGFPRKLVGLNQGALSVQGEMPQIAAVTDKEHRSIVLAYQNVNGFPAPCGLHPNVSHHSIVEWKLGESLNLLGETEFMDSHSTIGSIGLFARPNGVYFALQELNLNTCAQTWNVGFCSNGTIEVLARWGDSDLQAWSDDGWVLVYDKASQKTRLEKIQFAPQMKIRAMPDHVQLDWDEASLTDVLEKSRDHREWAVDAAPAVPPVRRPRTERQCFWRVRRTQTTQTP